MTLEEVDFSARSNRRARFSGLSERDPPKESFGKLLAFGRFVEMSVEAFAKF